VQTHPISAKPPTKTRQLRIRCMTSINGDRPSAWPRLRCPANGDGWECKRLSERDLGADPGAPARGAVDG